MPPLRQPATMTVLAEQQFVDMVTEAADGLIATPGDPMHVVILAQLRLAVRRLPEAAAFRLSQAVLAAVDKALVGDALERATSEVFGLLSACLPVPASTPDDPLRTTDLFADLASLAALSAPVDEEVARTLRIVASASLAEHLTRVDTTDLSAATTTAVVALLPRLEQIESLRLTSAMGASLASAVVYPLARSLHAMSRLSAVTLAQNASDNVLRVLAQACPDTLEELDVSLSRGVTDRGVFALRPCANLRILKLTGTSVTVVGAERALRELPWLQTLGNVPDLGRAITSATRGEVEDADEGGAKNRGELQLRAFKSDRPPPLDVLAEHCPRLDDVNIAVVEGSQRYRMPSVAALADAVPNLNRLSINTEDSTDSDVVEELLASTGGNSPFPPLSRRVDSLTVLKLHGTPLSAWDLWVIGHTFPRVEQLNLMSTSPSGSVAARARFQRSPCASQPLPEDAFRRLRLFYVEDLLPEAELLVLSRGTALEEIGLYHWDVGAKQMSLSEDALLEALRDNPLQQLKMFSAYLVPFLGERALQRILQCPQLKTLASLGSWGLLDSDRLERLQAEMDASNADLTIH